MLTTPLAPNELLLMNIFWANQNLTLNDVLKRFEWSRFKQSDVENIISDLQTIGLLEVKQEGGELFYYPLLSKANYDQFSILSTIDHYNVTLQELLNPKNLEALKSSNMEDLLQKIKAYNNRPR